MKKRFKQALKGEIIIPPEVLVAQGKVVVLNDEEEARWRREVLPLPKELVIPAVRKLDPGTIGIRGRHGTNGLEQLSVSNIAELFMQKTGIAPQGQGFEILIGIMDDNGKLEGVDVPQGARLKEVPNSDQAYVIQPVGEKQLVVAALADRGLYYGTLTLRQWLERHLKEKSAEIPLASVVDWPDLEERGYWHMHVEHIPWLAHMKMNRFYLYESFSVAGNEISFDSRSSTQPEWSPPFRKARRYAAEVVRGPGHLDYFERRTGYAEACPHLIGKGESAWNPASFEAGGNQRGPCATQPGVAKILAMNMAYHAAQGAAEEMVWMSEYPALQCKCDNCMNTGQYIAEVQAALTAWKEARQSYPDLKLSVFFGRGGQASAKYPLPERYPDHQIVKVMEMLPPDVTMRISMGCDGKDGALLAKFASQGKRISRMDVSYLGDRFQSEDIRLDLERRVLANKYIGAWTFTPGGFVGPESFRKTYNYRMCAIAEYEWNSKGRTAAEFAEAWAVRQGYADPVLFRNWVTTLNSPVGQRMYKAWGPSLKNTWLGRIPKEMAVGDFSSGGQDIPQRNMDAAKGALDSAEILGDTRLILVSRTLLAYCELEASAYDWIVSRDAGPADVPPQNSLSDSQLRERVAAALQKYIAARQAEIKDQGIGVHEKTAMEGSYPLEKLMELFRSEPGKSGMHIKDN